MLGNWVRMTSATGGNTNLTLVAVSGYPTVADCFVDNQRFQYSILNDSDGKPIECGIGYVTSGTTFVREKVIASYASGTYSEYPAAVNLAGTVRVIVAPLANGMGAVDTGISSALSRKRYVQQDGWPMADNTSGTLTVNRVYFTPGRIAFSGAVSGMAFSLKAAPASNANGRMGIYSCKPDGDPGGLIAETGNVALTSVSTTGIYYESSFTGGNISLPVGCYYLAYLTDVAHAIGAWGGQGNGSTTYQLGYDASTISRQYAMGFDNIAGGWSAMPSTLTVDGDVNWGTAFPVKLFLVAA